MNICYLNYTLKPLSGDIEWMDTGAATDDVKPWVDSWDDDDNEDEFAKQLRAELKKSGAPIPK